MNYNSHFAYLHVAGEEEKQNGGKKEESYLAWGLLPWWGGLTGCSRGVGGRNGSQH